MQFCGYLPCLPPALLLMCPCKAAHVETAPRACVDDKVPGAACLVPPGEGGADEGDGLIKSARVRRHALPDRDEVPASKQGEAK
jgi:hypothetical protein